MESLILDKKQLVQKINRIAIEIYEHNFQEKEIVVAGIASNGYIFAQLLSKELQQITKDCKVSLVKITLDKSASTLTNVSLDMDLNSMQNKAIILVDDVMNTGRVMAFALQPFLTIPTVKIQTAVMIDRSHQNYPIVADFVGYSLATTSKEHVEVTFEENKYGVYLH